MNGLVKVWDVANGKEIWSFEVSEIQVLRFKTYIIMFKFQSLLVFQDEYCLSAYWADLSMELCIFLLMVVGV